MILNRSLLLQAAPIKEMVTHKVQGFPTSYGLSEGGYDIRLKQNIWFSGNTHPSTNTYHSIDGQTGWGNFCLASAMEEFEMPEHLIGFVFNKSTWARQGLNVFTTVIEPGWKGFLTLELAHHGPNNIDLPVGCGIAQVIFCELAQLSQYEGKYQNQADMPMPAR